MSRSFRSSIVPQRNHRSDHPALQAAARLPAYIVLALMIVAVSAGGLLAARAYRGESPAAAADVAETPLPTPVSPSETPLPTPVPLGQTAIVDTAVAFWVEFVPEELAIEYHEEIVAAGGLPWLRSDAGRAGSDSPRATDGGASSTLAPSTDGAAPIATLVPVPVPASTDLATPAPLPAPSLPPLPVPLPLPTPTLPPLLP